MPLFNYLYTNDLNTPVYKKDLSPHCSGTRILWEIPGGVQAVEFDYALDPVSAYQFYKDNLGKRVVTLDQYLDYPVADSWIYGIAIAPFGCTVLCRGAWFRHFDEFDDTDYSLSQTSSAIIKASLTNFVDVASDDHSNIDETSFSLSEDGNWDLSDYGLYPGDVIKKLSEMSDSSYSQWNYWMRSAAFNGVTPQKPIPFFRAQVDDGTFNWQIVKANLGGNGVTQERNIEDLANRVIVIYRDIVGNEQTLTTWASDSDSQSDFWTREIAATGGLLTSDAADQYRDLILNKQKLPLLKRAMPITSPHIRDNYGSKWPLWYPIKRGGGYLRINDLFPTPDLFSSSWDRKRVGQMMTLEYDDSTPSLRVVLDTEDDRLDALLAQWSVL